MEYYFDPVNELRAILGPKPTHPWGALIPQILLWSFRRFCMKMLVDDSDIPATEQIWDDHFQLIHEYAPSGLEVVSEYWFLPENVEKVYSSLEEYNRYFLEFLVAIEGLSSKLNIKYEQELARFLDDSMQEIIYDWLTDFKEFIIFPKKGENEDTFTDQEFMKLIKSLLIYSSKQPQVAPIDVKVEPVQVSPPLPPPPPPPPTPPPPPPPYGFPPPPPPPAKYTLLLDT